MKAFPILIFTPLLSAWLFGGEISKDLKNVAPTDTVDVIVRLNKATSDTAMRQKFASFGQFKKGLPLVRAARLTIPGSSLSLLADDPDVLFVSPNRRVQATLDVAQPATNAAVALQYGYDGTGIGVAVIDSGVSASHPDLSPGRRSRVVYSQDFVGDRPDGSDAYGHGTHVAGIIAGDGTASTGKSYSRTFKGIAPNATIVNLRVLDATGAGTDSGVIAAIQRAIDLKNTYNIRVINLSLGRGIFESYKLDPLCQAVEQAWEAGIVVVAAAGNLGRDNSQGNEGYGTILAPANDPYVITVGAMKTMGTVGRGDDLIASYSSKGPSLGDHVVKPDLVAPGNLIGSLLASNASLAQSNPSTLIPSCYYVYYCNGSNSGYYFRLSGTSMAAPMVSGAAALMLEKDGSLTPDTIKARLMKTASKNFPAVSTVVDSVTGQSYTSHYDIFTIGAGYLDIAAALNNNDTLPTAATAMSPAAVYDPNSGSALIVFDSSVAWGTSVAWGPRSPGAPVFSVETRWRGALRSPGVHRSLEIVQSRGEPAAPRDSTRYGTRA